MRPMLELIFRECVRTEDAQDVVDLVASSGYFSEEEVRIAEELVLTNLGQGEKSGYFFVFAELQKAMVGYSCFGPIPATADSYHLYWIAVHEKHRGKGLGKAVMAATIQALARRGGKKVYAETSSRTQYTSTQKFYESQGFLNEACLKDYYRQGEDMLIYVRHIPS